MVRKTGYLALGSAALLVSVQVVGFYVCSQQEMLDTVIPFLPEASSCQLLAMDTHTDLTQTQREALDSALGTRYFLVYQSLSEVPDLAWASDPIVCEVTWSHSASGPMWFKSSYSVTSNYRVWTRVDDTYVWVLFRWVSVKNHIDGGRSEPVYVSAGRLTSG